MGAASLHLLLYDALELGYNVKHMYAIGSPRPGNKKFADAIWQKAYMHETVDAWRITHNRDPVPHLPPALLSYVHPLKEIYYGQEDGTTFKSCPSDPVDGKTCSSANGTPWNWRFGDHSWFLDVDPCVCPLAETVSTPNASTLVVV